MADSGLKRYLHHHLAGVGTLIDLLDHLENRNPGSPIATLAAGLRGDVVTDRETLEMVADRLGVERPSPTPERSWLADAADRLQSVQDDPAEETLRRLGLFELMSLALEGKRLAWRSLRAAVGELPSLDDVDFAALERRAVDQRGAIEAFRLGSAQGALRSAS